MKRFIWFVLIVILIMFLMVGLITFRFGSALWQEGNPTPILISAVKLEFSNSEYELFLETSDRKRYISENTGETRYDVIVEYMKAQGWDFQEQMGSGLLFNHGARNIVIETRQYSRHYILWDIPEEVFRSDRLVKPGDFHSLEVFLTM